MRNKSLLMSWHEKKVKIWEKKPYIVKKNHKIEHIKHEWIAENKGSSNMW